MMAKKAQRVYHLKRRENMDLAVKNIKATFWPARLHFAAMYFLDWEESIRSGEDFHGQKKARF